MISKSPNLLYQLAPRKFEELIARLFKDRGYEVSLTQSTRDGGYDLLAKIYDGIVSTVVLAECKRYKKENKVGVEVVRGLYGVTEAHRANQGLIITSSYFTKDAQEEQIRIGNRIGLRDFNNLVEWLKPYDATGSQSTKQ
jgi:HJR/Mrr/RecB family endonuclease